MQNRTLCLSLVLLLSSTFFSNLNAAAPTTLQSVLKQFKKSHESITSYQVTVKSSIRRSPLQQKTIEISSQVKGISGKRLYIKMSFTAPIRAASMKLISTMSFDETWQWIHIEQKINGKTARAQKLKVLLAKTRLPGHPFHTKFTLMGSGLLSGEDYPSTARIFSSIYNFKEMKVLKWHKTEAYMLLGKVDKTKLYAYFLETLQTPSKQVLKMAQKTMASLKLYIRKKDHRMIGYQLGANPTDPQAKVLFKALKFQMIFPAKNFTPAFPNKSYKEITLKVQKRQQQLRLKLAHFLKKQINLNKKTKHPKIKKTK